MPVDFGSTGVTGMHVSCVAALRRHFGLPGHPVKVWEPFQMLGEIEADLLTALGSDCTGVSGRGTMFGFANEGWHEWRTPWGQVVLVPEGFRPREDADLDTPGRVKFARETRRRLTLALQALPKQFALRVGFRKRLSEHCSEHESNGGAGNGGVKQQP